MNRTTRTTAPDTDDDDHRLEEMLADVMFYDDMIGDGHDDAADDIFGPAWLV